MTKAPILTMVAKPPSPRTLSRYRENVFATLDRMVARHIAAIHTEFTYAELIELSLPPSDRAAILRANELLSRPAGWSVVRLAHAGYEVQFMVPLDVGLVPAAPTMQTDISLELRDKFEEWFNERVKIGVEYGRLRAVLTALLEVCVHPAAQRWHFEEIRVVWQQNPQLVKFSDQHAKYRPNLSVPLLPYDLRRSMVLSFGVLNRFNLLGMPKEDSGQKITVTLTSRNAMTDEDGLSFNTL